MGDVAQLSFNHKFPNYRLGTQNPLPASMTHAPSLNEALATELPPGRRAVLWGTPAHRCAGGGGEARASDFMQLQKKGLRTQDTLASRRPAGQKGRKGRRPRRLGSPRRRVASRWQHCSPPGSRRPAGAARRRLPAHANHRLRKVLNRLPQNRCSPRKPATCAIPYRISKS